MATVFMERVGFGPDLDVGEGRLRGVRILGASPTKNGNIYTPEAVRRAVPLYEGAVVNVDHPSRERPHEDRKLSDRIGWLEGVTVDKAGGLTGTLNLLTSHPLFGPIMEAARRNPSLLGMSHNVEGRFHRKDGKRVVESIERVVSVDLVADPASTKSLYESLTDLGEPIRTGEPTPPPWAFPETSHRLLGKSHRRSDKLTLRRLLGKPAVADYEAAKKRLFIK